MGNDLNSFLFSTPEMTRAFSPREQLRAMMRFEWALTAALEKHSFAERGSASILESMLDANFLDRDALEREARDAGNIAIPFVRQLTAAVRARDERASRAIHLGATSQDVLDTALVLQMREAIALLENAINRIDAALTNQVCTHRDTILMGRTWLQPGPPVTLGLKLAGTLAALRRSRDRIRAAAQRGLGLWQAEWDTVPEAFRLAAAALAYSIEIAEGLTVNAERMMGNFDALLGMTLSEAVSASLAPKIGRTEAHELLRRATTRAANEKRHLREILKQMPEVTAQLSSDEIDRLMDPRAYLGSAQRFIDRVLGENDAGH